MLKTQTSPMKWLISSANYQPDFVGIAKIERVEKYLALRIIGSQKSKYDTSLH